MSEGYKKLTMNSPRLTLVFLFILTLVTSTAHAEEQKEKPILRGKIGKANVMFCFAQPESGRMPGTVVGYYYALATGNTQYLKLDENGQYFEDYTNDKIAPWQLDEITQKKITGYRLVGNKKERVDLSRLKIKPKKPTKKNVYYWENQGCDNAFNQPRVTNFLKQVKIQGKSFADKVYQVMVFEDGNSSMYNQLALLPDAYASAAFSQHKQKQKIEGDLYYRLDLTDGQNPSDETIKESIVYWDENWLTIRQVGEEYSGGAHPNFWQDFTNYNIETGKEEQLWDWFKNVKVTTSNSNGQIRKDYQPSAKFRKLVCKFDNFTACKKIFETDDDDGDFAYSSCVYAKKNKSVTKNDQPEKVECETIDESNRLTLGLTPRGLVVRTHLDFGSGSGSYNNLIPYTELMPYLNKKGRESVEQIMLNESVGQ